MTQKIHYKIEQNIVSEIKWDLKKENVTSKWFDSLWNEVFIHNKDLWKAKELMRVVLHDDDNSRWISLFPIIMGFMLLTTLWSFYYIFSWPKEELIEEKVVQQTETVLPWNFEQIQNGNRESNIETPVEDGGVDYRSMYEYANTEIIIKDREISLLWIEKESLLKEIDLKNNEILRLNEENLVKKWIISQKIQEIETISQRIPKKWDKEEFYRFLGKKVSEMCEKSQESKCKDLYYDFINE